jgi:nitrate reductase assembly molybdenum cofactor insertion protein NarJ
VHAEVEQRVAELGARLAAELESEPTDLEPALSNVRSELDTLAGRLDSSDARTAAALDALKMDLEAVVRSSVELLDHVDHADAGSTADLGERVEGLEQRLEAQDARAEEQVRVTEDALREGLASLGRRLAETESDYVEAGSALRRSIERLGAAIVEANGATGAIERVEVPVQAVQPDAYLAFVPNGNGYTLQELGECAPVVGESLAIPDSLDELVVTRIGRSPLPLDNRRCVYLERRSGSSSSLDRVP